MAQSWATWRNLALRIFCEVGGDAPARLAQLAGRAADGPKLDNRWRCYDTLAAASGASNRAIGAQPPGCPATRGFSLRGPFSARLLGSILAPWLSLAGGGLGFHLGFRQRLGAASAEHATAGRGKATPASSMGSHGSCGVRAHALAGWRLNLAPWAAPPTCLGEARALHRTFYVELRWHRVCGPHGIAWVACKRAARTHCLAGLRLRSAQSSCRDSSAGRASD